MQDKVFSRVQNLGCFLNGRNRISRFKIGMQLKAIYKSVVWVHIYIIETIIIQKHYHLCVVPTEG